MGSQDFLHTFSMALYHKWDVKNGFTYVLKFFSLISDGLGGVSMHYFLRNTKFEKILVLTNKLLYLKVAFFQKV